ncbi:MAG: hypothetical protein Q8O94_02535 [bacterium]|nr:hypothetical protein [bacterium]
MKKNKAELDVVYVVRLQRDLFARLKRAAAIEDLRASQLVRRALRRELETRPENANAPTAGE